MKRKKKKYILSYFQAGSAIPTEKCARLCTGGRSANPLRRVSLSHCWYDGIVFFLFFFFILSARTYYTSLKSVISVTLFCACRTCVCKKKKKKSEWKRSNCVRSRNVYNISALHDTTVCVCVCVDCQLKQYKNTYYKRDVIATTMKLDAGFLKRSSSYCLNVLHGVTPLWRPRNSQKRLVCWKHANFHPIS